MTTMQQLECSMQLFKDGEEHMREMILNLIEEAGSIKHVGDYGEYNEFSINEKELELLLNKIKEL